MDPAYFERVTRQTHVRRLLQKAVLNLCQKNYAACAPNLEVDGIICISFPDSPDQHVVKIHEKIQLDNVRPGLSYDRFAGDKDAFLQVQKSQVKEGLTNCNQENRHVPNRVFEDRDSMKNSYLDDTNYSNLFQDSLRNPVFPKMTPSVSTSNKNPLDIESNSSKSKRKMFKVVQRKRNTIEEPEVLSSSSNECSNLTPEYQSLDQKLPYENSPSHMEDKNNQIVSPEQKKNFSESVQDGYVIVKVESFDEEDDHLENKLSDKKLDSFNGKSSEHAMEQEPTRQWIQLPSREDNNSDLSPFKFKSRESLITIDAKVAHHSEGNDSYNDEIHKDNNEDNRIPTSVRQMNISDYHGNRDFKSPDFDTRDTSMQRSSQISNSQPLHQSPIMKSLLHKNKPQSNKGNVLDNLYLNKCADVPAKTNFQHKTSPLSSSDQPKKVVSMIDLQSTSSTVTEIKRPMCYNIATNNDHNDSYKEKKYFCRHCGKGFTLKCTRSRHEKTICGGGGEGQYRCHICSKVFTRSDSRCRHLWKTHGVKSASEITSMC